MSFQIGPFNIHMYGVMLALGALAAIFIAYIEARRRGENPDHLFNMALIVIPLGVIGARLYHVIDQWSYYSANPGKIIGGAGLGIFGAVAGGLLGLIIYTSWKKLNLLRWADILAPGLILAQGIGRWGNFFNQELYGYPTSLPWGIPIDPAHRLPGFEQYTHFHPLFLYESILDITGFVFLMIIGRKLKDRLKNGDIMLMYFIWYGVVRFILEGFKIEVWTIGGIPTARWISGALVIGCSIILWLRHRGKNPAAGGSGSVVQS
ncbi:phosphatidylglycerol:prolipoprotein diacylglycerol transferase [Dehalogenimonas formicexedens]|uniref:Phosphatidylglycerol--prolipoprotein diacylglyceryl transferase n=1 Tax=Dehalogenimonas formicexedens TaxID=1839801 RepID=A0A1P8F523_9CHLR|nr:prolipoprotein diacylglyceryl transferase [Dehalogenimonas formicexedens]APV43528.1 phosphatidylglycerol:prolipoprotein diacylglycerol transferase [Dehalogenimonas formicexedens]